MRQFVNPLREVSMLEKYQLLQFSLEKNEMKFVAKEKEVNAGFKKGET